MTAPLSLVILGSTGSIGTSTLDIVGRHSDKYRAVALTANKDVERLFAQCQQFQPEYAVMVDELAAETLRQKITHAGIDTQVLAGAESLVYVCGLESVDCVMAAIVGAAALLPTFEAVKHGKRILLANKEALVMSGQLFMDQVRKSQAILLPVDSEHNALFQCMPAGFLPGQMLDKSIEKILLTASGGPFRQAGIETLQDVTPEQACAHPNWDMGRKISVDSATMMNKGLEVIEACWLFSLAANAVQVVLHPQSIIHSMVQYSDGSVLGELGLPDMRTPIAHALAWPERIRSGVGHLDLFSIARLDFEPADFTRYPCLSLAYQAWEAGGSASTVLNAANEVAVDAFLDHQILFTDIPLIIERSLEQCDNCVVDSIHAVLDADRLARIVATEHIKKILRPVYS
ncbi:MAG: 1-deoxy-D-xylulose-5-phosphate reductoisomerase [Gammaproteobacteria bacterium]